MNQTQQPAQTNHDNDSSLLTITHIIYLLQALSFLNGITAIIGVIMNYIKLDDAKNTWIESHFRWQIRTFWFVLLWLFIGAITFWFFFIGWVIWVIAAIWYIYRIIKGWLRLSESKKMYMDRI